MRRTYFVLVPALALVAGSVALLDLASARAADAPADPWAQIQELEKAKDEGKCVAKMQEYRDSGGPAAIKNIATLRKSKSDKIACAAIKMAAAAGDPDHHKWLVKTLDDKDLAKPKDKEGRPDVYQAVLDALILYGEKNKGDGAQTALDDCIKSYKSTNAEYGARAVRAYGTVPNNATVEYLIKLAEALDSRSGKGGGGGGGGSGKGASTETRDIEGKVRNAAIETLNLLTDQDIQDAETFRKWWTEKAGKFVFPKPRDPNAPEAAVKEVGDISGLKEYNDEAYGYTAKKPDGEFWAFGKPDYPEPRVMMAYSTPPEKEGDKPWFAARCYFSIFSTKKYPKFKDIKAMVEWAKTEVFAKQMDSHDHPIEVSEATFGGATWQVVKGKGDGIEKKQGYGTMERRFYMTMIGSNILYIDAFVRLGAEDEIQKALWKAVEATVVTKK